MTDLFEQMGLEMQLKEYAESSSFAALKTYAFYNTLGNFIVDRDDLLELTKGYISATIRSETEIQIERMRLDNDKMP